ncbi:methylmalonyl-CoA mutase family protein [Bacillus sp. CECT 9360]|uniref:methylmalonyl-CoA mutase subunit beta n=1 Tax=Bacillus sp. CECT 9360 TaxID=2845821 RepID=UPI001E65740A|nr:methylmalonyl-CoA mutase family protein [Bacillus sp. CECT 9360]CAH0345659.1 Fused isobutyryl-CoA mutase [Bacillus sp. CECT 9360]
MKLKEVKNLSFPGPSLEDWKEAAESSLKGSSIEKLTTNTYEGIALQPLYTEKSLSEDARGELPGFFPYTRGIHITGYYQNPWLICQPVFAASEAEANQKMHDALSRGQNAIFFPASLLNGSLEHLFERLPLEDVPLFIDLEGNGQTALPLLINYFEKHRLSVNGVLAEDPIAEWVVSGNLPTDLDGYFNDWFAGIRELGEILPNVKSVFIKTSVYHNGGAHAIQELAFGLAEAVHYLNEGQKHGLSIEEMTSKIVFSFAVDSNYFMNIAKLRAGRRLWALLAEAYDVPPEYFKMHIHAETSKVTVTLYDKHVNILRMANQAFAAVVGGVQYMQVHPFDQLQETDNGFSNRLARNTQLVLKEETQITNVADPAGGSFYVEKLTDQLAEAVWAKFLEIENQGGIIESLNKGIIQSEISDSFNQRQENVASRKESIIGSNVYPNAAEKVKQPKVTKDHSNEKTAFIEITPIPIRRISEEFENIRLRAGAHGTQVESPKLGLINLGELKAYKSRTDFIKGIAAAGGIATVDSEGCSTKEDILAFIKDTNLKSYCLCGSDADYLEAAVSFVQAVKESYPDKNMYLVGKQDRDLEAALSQAGVNEFVHVRTNAVEILTQWLTEMGVE